MSYDSADWTKKSSDLSDNRMIKRRISIPNGTLADSVIWSKTLIYKWQALINIAK